jgi:hypothetical protein
VIDVARTRALRRAVQVCPDDEPLRAASQLFGVWWVDVEAIDITGATPPTPADDEIVDAIDASPRYWPRRAGLRVYDSCTALLRRATR